MKILTGKDIREADLYTMEHEPVASIELMERAALALEAEIVAATKTQQSLKPAAETQNSAALALDGVSLKAEAPEYLIIAGKGNNGGDGFASNCYLLTDDAQRAAILVDPSTDPKALLQRRRKPLPPLRCIVLTHAHFDHMLCLDAWRRETGAPLAVHRDDAPALAAEKLNAAERELSLVAADVVARRVGVCRVVPGAWPGLKSGPLRWLFGHLIPTYRWFSVRRDRCTACGACRRHCPTHNVVADSEGHPVWLDDCTGCLACYHYCPAQAVRYGPFTRRKGQYHYPERQGESSEKN